MIGKRQVQSQMDARFLLHTSRSGTDVLSSVILIRSSTSFGFMNLPCELDTTSVLPLESEVFLDSFQLLGNMPERRL